MAINNGNVMVGGSFVDTQDTVYHGILSTGTGMLDLNKHLDATGAVDDVEEDELAHLAPREHAAGEPPLLRPFLARLQCPRLGVHGRDLVAIGEPLRRHGRESTDAAAAGGVGGGAPSSTRAGRRSGSGPRAP